MSILHCPLCIGLALLSIGRAISHLSLVAFMAVPKGWVKRESGGFALTTTVRSIWS
jgi:hypothetical protein